MIRVYTLARERDGTIVEVLIVSKGREREEHVGSRWPATSYADAKATIKQKNESLARYHLHDRGGWDLVDPERPTNPDHGGVERSFHGSSRIKSRFNAGIES